MENKKIKNARTCIYNGIGFKSELEKNAYILMQKESLSPEYEKNTFTLWEGRRFKVPCYEEYNDRKLKKKVWGLNSYKPVSIRYTPDFIINTVDSSGIPRMIVIEAKGYPNDRYQYVKKMFRLLLEEKYPQSIFFEIHSIKQLKAAIQIIKNL